jgi:hypothetical protein
MGGEETAIGGKGYGWPSVDIRQGDFPTSMRTPWPGSTPIVLILEGPGDTEI